MKTIKKWLSELPEPYKTQAHKYMESNWGKIKKRSLSEALKYAFVWHDTEEGFEYWNMLHEQLSKQP